MVDEPPTRRAGSSRKEAGQRPSPLPAALDALLARAKDDIDRLASQLQDVQALRLARDALRRAEAHLRLALAAGGVGTWELDVRSRRVARTVVADELFGMTGEGERTIDDYIAQLPDEEQARVRGALDAALAQGGEHRLVFRVVLPSGEQRWLEARGEVLHDERGELDKILGVLVDVTARKHIEEMREHMLDSERAARGEAERASRQKDEFVAIASHELRTPLNAILGWTQLLRQESAITPQLAKGLEVIERNARAQAQLISDLLDVSRIVSGKLQLELAAVDLMAIVGAVLDNARTSAAAKGVELRCPDCSASAHTPVLGDASRLEQVVWNLVSNAIKFTPRGGFVEVGLTSADGKARFFVHDSGQGIAPEFLPHVFERFRQANSSAARHHGGLGLGLPISKHLVELHGGEIRVESPGLGHGTRFTVELPLATAAGASGGLRPTVEPGAAAATTLRGVRILAVDDEPDARELLARILEEKGAQVVTAASGQEALEILDRLEPDVIVSDIGMPGMDGYAFLRAARDKRSSLRRTPALALTAFARDEDRERVLRSGYQAHLAKPIEPAHLVTAIRRVCDSERWHPTAAPR